MRSTAGIVAWFVVASAACSDAANPTPNPSVSRPADTTAATPGATREGPTGSTSPPPARAQDAATAAAHPPLFVGRFDTTDPSGPRAAWPGCRVLTRFRGTAVAVTLREFAEDWMGGAPSFWEVSIDHGEFRPLEMIPDNQPHVFTLAQGLADGPHDVEIYKRSETQTGITQFLGFDFRGGTSLPPPARQTRRIEVMGDSGSSGFGVELLNAPNHDCPGADHGGRWQNFRKAWGALLGTKFDAEVHGIVYSGKGIRYNIWPTDNDPLAAYYPRANPNPAIANSNPPLFDLASWIPDATVLMQGAVDFARGIEAEEFTAVYRSFVVDQLRARSPATHIFLVVPGKNGREVIAEAARQLEAERAALGDDKVHAVVPNLYTWDEMVGCNGHGTPAYHQRIANEIGERIRAALGW